MRRTQQWYLEKLYQETDQPTLRFAFQGTINWMRALAIAVDTNKFQNALATHFQNVQERKHNQKFDLIVFENILMAIHNLHSIQTLNEGIDNPYSIARTQVVSWYYCIFHTCKAMIGAFSGNSVDNHSGVAKTWHKEIIENNLVLYPFDFSLNTLIEKDVKKIIQQKRNGNSFDVNTSPTHEDEALGALFSYLQGTAKYKREEIEEELKKSRDFKDLEVSDFRTKRARDLRDARLAKGNVNFLTQAFRYRGKAHYRDSVFLSYGDNNYDKMEQFIQDLETVAMAFLKMGSTYIEKRVNKKSWDTFLLDLNNNLRFEFDTTILQS